MEVTEYTVPMQMIEGNQKDITLQAVQYLGLKYRRQGDQLTVSCPFHKDTRPSMGIQLSTGRYHCFSCNRGGHIAGMFKELTGQSMYKALGLNNDKFSIFGMSGTSFMPDWYNSDPAKNINLAADFAKMQSPYMSDLCSEYIRQRGIQAPLVRKYGLRYADNMMINGTWFKKRLVVPVYEEGKLISLEGRRLVDDGTPKVLYPRNCSVNTLFDIDNLNRDDTLYVVEGLMDLFVLKSCDVFQNSTSIFGACLTKRQQDLLSQFRDVVMIPDSDEAGQKPIEILKERQASNISILRLPAEVDGKPIKDVGDLPKIGSSVQALVDKSWMQYIKRL